MTHSHSKKPSRRFVRGKKNTPKPVRLTLEIERLAHKGDGEATTPNGKTYIAGALPHEIVEADVIGERGKLVSILSPSPDRIEPPCPSFGLCGGCSLQHMRFDTYLSWKEKQLQQTLESRDIGVKPKALLAVSQASRRRVTFAAEKQGKNIIFGFHHARSHKVVAIKECLLLTPAINKAFNALKEIADFLCPKRGSMKIHVLDSESGLDVRVDGFDEYPDFKVEQELIKLALKNNFARLHLGDELLVEQTRPHLTFGTAKVTLPSGGFCQATQQSQEILQNLVCHYLEGKKHIVDLFSGSGTFSLALAKKARLHTVEGDEASLNALKEAHGKSPHLKPLTLEKRDLFRRPLSAKELDRYDGLVLDPPRAGAREQVAEIIKSNHKQVVYVSCSPASFSRDAALLIKAGFGLKELTPLDQFLFSHHIELIGVFEKE